MVFAHPCIQHLAVETYQASVCFAWLFRRVRWTEFKGKVFIGISFPGPKEDFACQHKGTYGIWSDGRVYSDGDRVLPQPPLQSRVAGIYNARPDEYKALYAYEEAEIAL